MDSKLAADPIARGILDKLSLLERTAGVRAHYRILDPLPLQSTDTSALQTAARMIGDWIGLRNTIFHIVPGSGPVAEGTTIRSDGSADEFTMELPSGSTKTIADALAAIAVGVARAYLVKANIRHAITTAKSTATPAFVDVTTIFLGFGKLVLNCTEPKPPNRALILTENASLEDAEKRLPASYLAFTHRVVCAMRGLDYEHHMTGLTPDGISLLRAWDVHRDSLLTLSLRNVLTAAVPHRPLLDALSDNRIGLARMDQIIRFMEVSVLEPMRSELAGYHKECREAANRLAGKEPETYDPCLIFLNHARRRMDMQHLADGLATQQETIIRRLQILLRALNGLDEQGLVISDASKNGSFPTALCPFDRTPLTLAPGQDTDFKATCSLCGYELLAAAQPPAFAANFRDTLIAASPDTKAQESPAKNAKKKTRKPAVAKPRASGPELRKRSAGLIGAAVGVIALSWVPLLGYALVIMWQNKPLVHGEILGKVGLGGSCGGGALFAVALLYFAASLFRKPDSPQPPADTPKSQAAQ